MQMNTTQNAVRRSHDARRLSVSSIIDRICKNLKAQLYVVPLNDTKVGLNQSLESVRNSSIKHLTHDLWYQPIIRASCSTLTSCIEVCRNIVLNVVRHDAFIVPQCTSTMTTHEPSLITVPVHCSSESYLYRVTRKFVRTLRNNCRNYRVIFDATSCKIELLR